MISENRIRIECEDIYLREYRLEDVDALYQLTWQPHFHQFLIDWNVSLEQRVAWMKEYEIPENQRFLRAVAEGSDIGELRLRLSILHRTTGEFIGVCGSGILDRVSPANREIYYGISEHARNRGYTTQAAQALIRFLFEHTRVQELIAIAQVRNPASNRVLQKCGFQLQQDLMLEEQAYHYYKLRATQ
ncbi:GNAT family N-acetyltransferase [Paenibacillus guangzhouensis]|uniref:GNAT family N-acetyltransferase n=1 Tax=Paenibacillus guangzhouensis TaxID=1473112 RepID=UPI00187B47A8|nr:GNAT family N-acetyltransferase [Paenibacillus guangzhouensis]